jgi:membrane protease YdiL (CAAX protease family)
MLTWWVVVILAAIPVAALALVLHWPDNVKNALAAICGIPALVAWTYFYRRRVDRRPWRGMGLRDPRRGLPQVGAGFLAGIVVIGAWFLVEYTMGWIRVVGTEPATSGLPLTVGFLLVGLVANAGAGFLEEIGYRGYVLQNLGRQLPVWLATPLTAFLFAIVVHFNNLTLFFVLVATLVGVLLAITRLGTGAIWFAIGLHWSLDASQNYFFGLGHESTPYGHSLLHLQARSGIVAPNSEDPVFLVIVLAAIVVGLVWVHHARRFRWNARLNEDGQPET